MQSSFLTIVIFSCLNVKTTCSSMFRESHTFDSHPRFPLTMSELFRTDHDVTRQDHSEDSIVNYSETKRPGRIKRNGNNCPSQTVCPQNASSEDHVQRPPCRCDEDCNIFGDCCSEVTVEASNLELFERLQYFSESSNISFECHPLPPPMEWFDAFMVVDCPRGTSHDIKSLCKRDVPEDRYHYSLDVPVVSSTHKNRVYRNIYCAKCNIDSVSSLDVELNCRGTVQEKDYIRGYRTWHQDDHNSCSLNIHYNLDEIRWCPKNLVSSCTDLKTTDVVEACHRSASFYIVAGSKTYKNRFCSLCNGNAEKDEQCLTPISISQHGRPGNFGRTYITTFFSKNSTCRKSELIDPINNTCIDPCINEDCTGDIVNMFPRVSPKINPHNCMEHLLSLEGSIFYPNGTIILRNSELIFHHGEYEIVRNKWIKSCWKERERSFTFYVLSRLTFTISLVSLGLHIIIFLLLPRKRNIPSMNLFSLTISLFIGTIIFIFFFRLPHYPNICFAFALVLYYFMSAAFLWMNVLSIDIYRTFRSNTYKITSSKAFLQYSLYAWITPLFTTSIVGAVDHVASRDFPLIPDFGVATCWFNNKWGLAAFFSAPACIIILINMSLYALSVYVIVQQHKLGKLASSTANLGSKCNNTKDTTKPRPVSAADNAAKPNGSFRAKFECDKETFFKEKFKEKLQKKMRMHKKLCFRLVLYSKLALIMGMTWIFAFLSFHTRSVILEYLFIIFNGFQGTFIFIAFDCKKKVIHNLKQKLGIELPNQATGSIMHSSTTEPLPKTASSNIRLTSYKLSKKSNAPSQINILTCV